MVCAHCLTPVPEDARYCHACGSLVSDAEGQASASASLDRDALLRLEGLLQTETGSEYEIVRRLGRGGMAVVFLAREVNLARFVAIKVLPPELTFGHGLERFKREARTAAALDHPHIIQVYRVGSGRTLFWYAMRYVEGHSLDEILRERGSLPLDEVVTVLGQVAAALDYAHERNVVHRDVKPANVMIDKSGRAIVTDFGIAKAFTAPTLTASGSMIGTPHYMSPEQWLGRPVEGASDQYSLGVMAYRMLAGRVPFEGETAAEILQQHYAAIPPPLEALAPGLPVHVCTAVHRALHKVASARFSTASAFVHALRYPASESPAGDGRSSEADTERIERSSGSGSIGHSPHRVAIPDVSAQGARSTGLARGTKAAMWLVGIVTLAAAVGGVAAWPPARRALQSLARERSPEAGDARSPAGRPGAREAAMAATSELEAQPPQAPGAVFIDGLPRGSVIVAGGIPRPMPFMVAPGEHHVEVSAPGFEPYLATVRVSSGDTARLGFAGRRLASTPVETRAPRTGDQPPAVLRLQVQPPGRVVIDGVDLGERGQLVHNVAGSAPHRIRVVPVRPGFVPKDTTVMPRPGDTVTVRIRLERGQ